MISVAKQNKQSTLIISSASFYYDPIIVIKQMSCNSQECKLARPIPAYLIKINTSAFHYKKPSILQRTQEEHLQRYWAKLGMDQKVIGPSCEDRLSELTTSQIDRIIDMEKIKSVLHDKKKKAKETYFTFTPKNINNHANVYQANFLAKINQIAIRRNIRHQAFQGFMENSGDILSHNDKKIAPAPFKYRKQYESESLTSCKRTKNHYAEDDDQKSIASIQDQLQLFEQQLSKSKRNRQSSLRRRQKTQYDNSVQKRWFYGMSNMYINQSEAKEDQRVQVNRSKTVDIQSEVTYHKASNRNPAVTYSAKKVSLGHIKTMSTDISANKSKHQEPLQRFKPAKIVTLQ